MKFIHQDPEFDELLRVVAEKRSLALGLVEKDYWVTHALWALKKSGLEIWFKGGTSLSKAYGLLQRFSEDLDLKIASGKDAPLPLVSNWKGDGTRAIAERRAFFKALSLAIQVPGAKVELQPTEDKRVRAASLRVQYAVRHREAPEILRPFVLLEVGEARVTPHQEKTLSSFVHDELDAQGQSGDFEDNRPRGLRCVHPLVTLIEKLDAMSRRFPKPATAATTFIRHYEDAARIAQATRLPPISDYVSVKALAIDLLEKHQIVVMFQPNNPAFAFGKNGRWDELQAAWVSIAPMFWGPRITLEESCGIIRKWIGTQLV